MSAIHEQDRSEPGEIPTSEHYLRVEGVFDELAKRQSRWDGDDSRGLSLLDGDLEITILHRDEVDYKGDEFMVGVTSEALPATDPNLPSSDYGSFRVRRQGVIQMTLPNNTQITIDGKETEGVYDKARGFLSHKTIPGQASSIPLYPETGFGKIKGEELVHWLEATNTYRCLIPFPKMTIDLIARTPSAVEAPNPQSNG